MVTKGLTGHADGETYIIHAAGADRSAVRHTVGVKRRVAGVTRTRAYGVQVSGRVYCRNRVIRCRYVTVILERFSRSKLGIVSKNNRTILYNNTIGKKCWQAYLNCVFNISHVVIFYENKETNNPSPALAVIRLLIGHEPCYCRCDVIHRGLPFQMRQGC